MKRALAVVWIVVGVYAVWTALKHRTYVHSLAPSAGNALVKTHNRRVMWFGMVSILGGVLTLLTAEA